MNFNIRKANPSDIDAVMRIIDVCRDDLLSKGLDTWDDEYPNRELLNHDLTSGSVFLAYPADDSEHVVGTITLTPHMYERALRETTWLKPTDAHMEIARMGVDPSYHGRGLGRELFDHAFRFAIRMGTESIRLEVLTKEQFLIDMYERRGFIQRGPIWEEHKEFTVMEYVTPEIKKINSTKEHPRHEQIIAACHVIRREVFIIGQDVPEEIDLDGRDTAFDHILLKFGDIDVGCVRLNTSRADMIKLERIAVIEKYRGYGFGKILIESVIELCEERKISTITMHAQYYLTSYYGALGFSPVGEPFYEADIKHIEMIYRR